MPGVRSLLDHLVERAAEGEDEEREAEAEARQRKLRESVEATGSTMGAWWRRFAPRPPAPEPTLEERQRTAYETPVTPYERPSWMGPEPTVLPAPGREPPGVIPKLRQPGDLPGERTMLERGVSAGLGAARAVVEPIAKGAEFFEEESIAPLGGRITKLGEAAGFVPGEWRFQKPSLNKLGEVLGMTTEEARDYLREQPMATQVLAEMSIPLAPGEWANVVRAVKAAGKPGVQLTRGAVIAIADEVAPGTSLKLRGVPAAEGAAVRRDPVATLQELIEQAKPVRAETEILKSEELTRRAGALRGVLQSTGYDPREATAIAKGLLKGELPKAAFTPPGGALGPDEMVDLFARIRDANLPAFTDLNTRVALEKVLLGELPTKGEITALERVFGADLARAIGAKTPLGSRIWSNIAEALNIPRTLMAAYDLSFPLRQGIFLAVRHPKEFAASFGRMLKAAWSETGAQAIDDSIRNSPTFALKEQSGLYHAPLTGGELAAREEAFIASAGERTLVGNVLRLIPGVRASERAYITFGNTVRSGIFDTVHAGWQVRGLNRTPQDYRALGNMLNIMSGRGDLKALNRAAPLLSAVFFSPRLLMARVQTPALLLSESPAIRRLVAEELLAFTGTGIGVLSLLKLSGLADVQLDPRQSDFGRIKIGPTRLDFWAGMQPIARTVARIITGETRSATDFTYPVDRLETLGRFTQSKLSPVAGLFVDVMRGETFIGEQISPSGSSLKEQTFNRITPLFFQDLIDAAREGGPPSAALALSGFLGVGVLSYRSLAERQNQIAQELLADAEPDSEIGRMGGRDWRLWSPRAKADARRDPRMQDMISEIKDKGGTVGRAFERVGEEELARIITAIGDLEEGRNPQDFWDKIAETQKIARVARNTIITLFDVSFAEPSHEAPEQEVVNAWAKYALEPSVDAFGRLDGERFGELDAQYRAMLDPDTEATLDRQINAEANENLEKLLELRAESSRSGYWDIPTEDQKARRKLRAANPHIDALLFLTAGTPTADKRTVRSKAAQDEVLRIVKELFGWEWQSGDVPIAKN